MALTSALGSSLVNMLYVLDEPSIGLHPQRRRSADSRPIDELRDRGNTVVVVEHEEAMIRAADQVDRDRPRRRRARRPGRFSGHPAEMEASAAQLDGRLSGRAGAASWQTRAAAAQSRLDSPGRRAGQQPAKHHGRIPARACCAW